ncbi:hypothetical protein Drose_21660 [Dactylosporangium roseum]|uniref:Uncharacterized protein n=1 Tax=Dactylosporangium roseum TaxID=47989 RepID=A0ABY5YVU7_9ACTN|nr:hypothetical protein [Dactylosporangium roseum]UWZ33876.1 hypothetical protein Drose_21660 [Dactylosporangium roseum]
MADLHELMVAADLRGDLAEPDLAELRWHLGLGPRPEHVTAATVIVVARRQGTSVPPFWDGSDVD